MGTRADFYVGRGEGATWKGSIAWDGHPEGIPSPLLGATTEAEFNRELIDFASSRDDFTTPDEGWPWPWKNSQTTDYSYALFDGKVWASCFGYAWFDPQQEEPESDEDEFKPSDQLPSDMLKGSKPSARVGGKKSGVMVFTVRKD